MTLPETELTSQPYDGADLNQEAQFGSSKDPNPPQFQIRVIRGIMRCQGIVLQTGRHQGLYIHVGSDNRHRRISPQNQNLSLKFELVAHRVINCATCIVAHDDSIETFVKLVVREQIQAQFFGFESKVFRGINWAKNPENGSFRSLNGFKLALDSNSIGSFGWLPVLSIDFKLAKSFYVLAVSLNNPVFF